MTDDTDRTLDADLGEQDGPDPGTPEGVVEVATDWTEPTDDETEEDPVRCKHCAREISADTWAVHLTGGYRGKRRCDPDDSGMMYGYEAAPEGVECASPCIGARADHA